MEGDGSADGRGGSGGAGENKDMLEVEPKVKRKMKTPSQLETLEKTYAMESYPSESLRAELSVKLGLSDRQLQMWFCHRRLKDRKLLTEKRQKERVSPSPAEGPSAGSACQMAADNADAAKARGPVRNLFGGVDIEQPQQQRVVHKVGTALPRISAEVPSMRRFCEPPLAVSEQRAIAFVEAQLAEPLREDGPILGMEFDPLPPGSFGEPIDQQHPAGRSYDNHSFERPDNKLIKSNEQVTSGYGIQSQITSLLSQHGRQGHHVSPASGEVDVAAQVTPLVNVDIDAHYHVHPVNGLNNQIMTDKQIVHDQERLERKRKSLEARIAKEVEAHEKRIRKELEKQDILRRKREEQMRKEMEKQDRERRKEEERLLREKQREEERNQREQRREIERREKFLQKEYIKAEKIRLKEEMRKEKVAAKLKAANDKAAARRISKGSLELIDDEQLELMELAALSQGLSSVLALDSETLQNLDLFKDKLLEFPPKSVVLKRPFRIHPWNDSEEDVGNLLMAWRFLITFADVLGLWPFTLDEFTQAFHDCDPRLLGEIHIAILRSVIKDIEDVARTPATAAVPNQNSVLISGGGHPQIVDGAYAWGFNLVSWKCLLTPLTWPEVLRQMALSAGFGPKLKQNMYPPSFHDEHEAQGDDGETVISNLRSGAAAENAVAIMQERRNPRRSRHRLTPGTVKFAAFHVLSMEGDKGLSIVDVAHKIQNSGLRDLTTSKTPEASISAALSRDTKLFKRTAPSTYCVRSPYRKDSIDADAVLAAAREKIRLYQSGNADGEAEEVEKDDAERDQDSESDTADDPDADDLDAISKLKEDSHSSEVRIEDKSCLMYVKENSCIEYMKTPLDGPETQNTSLKLPAGETCNGTSGNQYMNLTGIHSQVDSSDQEDNLIDDNGSGEPWVQALTEGEYADLSIEERLNALVTLINVVNEGNTMRIALEERLEAANALKKQMWAEAQLDKRRTKEENILKFPQHSSVVGNRAEHHPPVGTTEDKQSPLSGDTKNMLPSTNYTFQLVDLNEQQNDQSYCNDINGKSSLMPEVSMGSDNLLLHQSVYDIDKSRSELKALIGHLAEDVYVYRSLPLGLDRKRNRYWLFITSSRNDPGNGRIYVELNNGFWRLIDSEEGFDALMSCLDIRGIREYHLHSMLKRIEVSFKEAAKQNLFSFRDEHSRNQVNKGIVQRPMLDTHFSKDNHSNLPLSYLDLPYSSVPFACELEKSVIEETELIDRYKDVEKWMLEECFDSSRLNAFNSGKLRCKPLLEICKRCHDLFTCDDNHCPSCHVTCSASEKMLNFPEHVTQCNRKLSEERGRVTVNLSLSPRVRLLKAILATTEASIPSEALASVWSDEYRGSWRTKLQRASSAEVLLQILAMLENSIKREFLSENYKTTSEILNSSNIIADSSEPEAVAVLPWIPKTTSAVALRLMELDSSIYHTVHHKEAKQKDNEAGHLTMLPSRCYVLGSMIDNDSQGGYQQQNNRVDLVSAHVTTKRGRGRPRGPTRTRGGKSMRTTVQNKFQEFPGWKGRPRRQGGHSKGHRSISRRQKITKGLAKNFEQRGTQELQQEEWNLEETRTNVAGDENGSSSERPESSDGNSEVSADEYTDVLVDYSAVRNGDSRHSTGLDLYNNGRDDDKFSDNDEDDAEVEVEGNVYDDELYKNDFSEEENQSTGVEEQQVRNMDGGCPGSSSSADYSY